MLRDLFRNHIKFHEIIQKSHISKKNLYITNIIFGKILVLVLSPNLLEFNIFLLKEYCKKNTYFEISFEIIVGFQNFSSKSATNL